MRTQLVALALLGLIAGCGGAAIPEGRTLPNAAPLVIGNDAPAPLCGAFLMPTGAARWGASRLGEGERVAPRAARTFFFERGSWDILLQDCGGGTVSSGRGIHVGGYLGLYASNLTPFRERRRASRDESAPRSPSPSESQPEGQAAEGEARERQPEPEPALPTYGVSPAVRGGAVGVAVGGSGPTAGTSLATSGAVVGISPRAGSEAFGN